MTLRFIGELDASDVSNYHSELDEYARSFPLKFDSLTLSGFPSSRRARVVVLLLKSKSEINAAWALDAKFSPHITLGYARRRPVDVPEKSAKIKLAFESVGLYESTDRVYKPLRVVD